MIIDGVASKKIPMEKQQSGEKCQLCNKLVANKYYNTYSILCEKCYSNRLLEVNSAESEILGNIVHSIEKPKNSSLITINCKIELAKEHKIQTIAMIDTGSIKSVVREELVPEKYRQKLAVSRSFINLLKGKD
jgi:hypothetical protein